MLQTPQTGRVRVHRILPLSEVEGPGKRACLWVQGCPLACAGCFNGETWDFKAGSLLAVGELFRLLTQRLEIEGVTFTGGEPFAQAAPLAELGSQCRELGLSIVTYSGYDFHRLKQANRRDWNALLGVSDLLLAGPFIRAKVDFSRPWVGSTNQQFVFLTDRYRPLEPLLRTLSNGIEVVTDEGARIRINGMASASELTRLTSELASLGLRLKSPKEEHDKDDCYRHR